MDEIKALAIKSIYLFYHKYNNQIKTIGVLSVERSRTISSILGIRSDIPPIALLNEIKDIIMRYIKING